MQGLKRTDGIQTLNTVIEEDSNLVHDGTRAIPTPPPQRHRTDDFGHGSITRPAACHPDVTVQPSTRLGPTQEGCATSGLLIHQ